MRRATGRMPRNSASQTRMSASKTRTPGLQQRMPERRLRRREKTWRAVMWHRRKPAQIMQYQAQPLLKTLHRPLPRAHPVHIPAKYQQIIVLQELHRPLLMPQKWQERHLTAHPWQVHMPLLQRRHKLPLRMQEARRRTLCQKHPESVITATGTSGIPG